MSALRVCVDARLPVGVAGGVQQVIIGLANGLSGLTEGDEEYLFLVYPDAAEWLRPYVYGPCRFLNGPALSQIRPPRWKRLPASVMPVARRAWNELSPLAGRRTVGVPKSDGVIEKAGAEIVVFPGQEGFLTEVPSVYHPHDLQHVHFPEFFNRRERLVREVLIGTYYEQARMVGVVSSWIKQDFVRHYGPPEDKVQVVPWAPVLSAYPTPSDDDLASAQRKFSLPEAFVFYPAHIWPHKNHIGLLEALALLRDRHGLRVPFVSSGRLNKFFPKVQERARELRLTDQLQFLGFVSPLELQCLYRLCRSVAVPSRFEAASFPLWEAFLAGAPVVCSNVTSLPRQAGDAALVVDPDKTEEIAEAVHRLWTDEVLRRTLVERGKESVARFTWNRTARAFRAHYRQIANRPLTEEDKALLAAPPLL